MRHHLVEVTCVFIQREEKQVLVRLCDDFYSGHPHSLGNSLVVGIGVHIVCILMFTRLHQLVHLESQEMCAKQKLWGPLSSTYDILMSHLPRSSNLRRICSLHTSAKHTPKRYWNSIQFYLGLAPKNWFLLQNCTKSWNMYLKGLIESQTFLIKFLKFTLFLKGSQTVY